MSAPVVAAERIADHLRFAIGVLEAAAPPRQQDEGHYANRALTYLYAIRAEVFGDADSDSVAS